MDHKLIVHDTDRWRRLVFWCYRNRDSYEHCLWYLYGDKKAIKNITDYVLQCYSIEDQRRKLITEIKSEIIWCKLVREVNALKESEDKIEALSKVVAPAALDLVAELFPIFSTVVTYLTELSSLPCEYSKTLLEGLRKIDAGTDFLPMRMFTAIGVRKGKNWEDSTLNLLRRCWSSPELRPHALRALRAALPGTAEPENPPVAEDLKADVTSYLEKEMEHRMEPEQPRSLQSQIPKPLSVQYIKVPLHRSMAEVAVNSTSNNNEVNKNIFKTLKRNQVSVNFNDPSVQPKLLICVPTSTTSTSEHQNSLQMGSSRSSTDSVARNRMPVHHILPVNNQTHTQFPRAGEIRRYSPPQNTNKQEIYIYASQLYGRLFSEPVKR